PKATNRVPAAGEALSRQSNKYTQETIQRKNEKKSLPDEYDRFLNICCTNQASAFMKITQAQRIKEQVRGISCII
ncbi:hypothetical protein, partial [Roseinatronobacter sp.]|uniref:hypothetical protein n=1 Tax=Roseinatronobacter sp. TaxID=1945755 RepID=UPI003F70EC6A